MSRRSIAAAVVLLVAVLASRSAWCDEIIPTAITDPVTVIKPGLHLIHPLSPHFLLDRFAVDACNADAARIPALERQVLDLSLELGEARKPEAGWRIAGRWAAIGLGIGAAFVAGVWVGS